MSSLDKIRKERRDLAILIIAFGLVIGCVLYDLARAVYFQGISHPVASTLGHDIAPGGRVPFQHTSPIGIGLLSAGLVIRSISIIASAIFLIQIGRHALRGNFFIKRNLCLFRRSSLNKAWSQQFEFPNYLFTVSYLFFITLIIMTIIVKRGMEMQLDQEGLI